MCSRWLSAAAPSGFGCERKNAACNPAGVQELLVVWSSGGVVARAPQPPATGFDASGIFFDQNMSFRTAKSINEARTARFLLIVTILSISI